MVVAVLVIALVMVVIGAGVIVFANPFAVSPLAPADDTIWAQIASQVRDGKASPQVALEGFAYLFNVQIPGVRVPPGRDADAPTNGDVVTSWVRANWTSFTPQ